MAFSGAGRRIFAGGCRLHLREQFWLSAARHGCSMVKPILAAEAFSSGERSGILNARVGGGDVTPR
jgi:hypothetical protein